MLKEFVEKIVSLADCLIQTDHGRAYVGRELSPLPSPDAKVDPIRIHTLSGLCNYAKSKFDYLAREATTVGVVVDGALSVRLVSEVFGEFNQRDEFSVATPYQLPRFPFGQLLDPETFIVQLQSCFVLDPNAKNVLRIVGNLEEQEVSNWDDDGMTQEVTIRAGIANKAREKIPNPILLAPFRTFQEIEQPASEFLIRAL